MFLLFLLPATTRCIIPFSLTTHKFWIHAQLKKKVHCSYLIGTSSS